LMTMFYVLPGPIMWVTPLSAFPTAVPPTASYYTVPQYYLPPPAAPVEPVTYGMPVAYGAPAMYEPSCYAPVPAPWPQRGEYPFGRYLPIY